MQCSRILMLQQNIATMPAQASGATKQQKIEFPASPGANMHMRPSAEIPYPRSLKMPLWSMRLRSLFDSALEQLFCLAEGINPHRPVKILVPWLVEQYRRLGGDN